MQHVTYYCPVGLKQLRIYYPKHIELEVCLNEIKGAYSWVNNIQTDEPERQAWQQFKKKDKC